MTTNDAQIDVLLRRYARGSQSIPPTEHLDADELNAFAEGSLPDSARARYVSHLVDCDNCRQIVSQLAMSSGAVLAAEATTAPEASGSAWWKRLSGFFSPLTLRYAAFAMVLIAAAGIVFVVTRRPAEPSLVALNKQANPATEGVVKPLDGVPQTGSTSPAGDGENRKALGTQPGSTPQPAPSSDQIAKLDEKTRSEDSPTSPPKPAKEGEAITNPTLAANKKAESAEAAPSYAPAPPGQTQQSQTQSREQQNTAGFSSVYGARKSGEPVDASKQTDRGRGSEAGKDTRQEDDLRVAQNQAQVSRRTSDEKVKGPRRDVDNNQTLNRSANQAPATASRAQSVGTADRAAAEEKTPETRSAGGRKFKRQGSGWVDTKFKTSMPLKSIARGSSDYAALDSGLRSIAQQLGGEVIVVWKGKGYLIK